MERCSVVGSVFNDDQISKLFLKCLLRTQCMRFCDKKFNYQTKIMNSMVFDKKYLLYSRKMK